MKSSGIDAYRSQASFKVEDLRNTIFGEEYARYRVGYTILRISELSFIFRKKHLKCFLAILCFYQAKDNFHKPKAEKGLIRDGSDSSKWTFSTM